MNPEEPNPAPADHPPVQGSPLRVWGVRLLKGTIIVLTLYFTWRFLTQGGLEWHRLAQRVSEARASCIILGVGLLLVRYPIWDWRFRLSMRRVMETRSGPVLGFFVLIASAALNLITPTARVLGGMMRARYFARANRRPFGFLYGVVLFDQAAHHTVMSVCTWITLIVTAYALDYDGFGTLALVALVVCAVLLVIWGRRQGPSEQSPIVRYMARRAERAEGRLQKMLAHGHEAVGVFVKLLGVGSLRLPAAVLGVIYFLVNAAAQWAMFVAIGAPVNPFVVLAVVAVGTAAGTLSGAPGGLGATELAMMASFEVMGVDKVTATAGTLLYRGLHYASVLVIGLPALGLLEWRSGQDKNVPTEGLDSPP